MIVPAQRAAGDLDATMRDLAEEMESAGVEPGFGAEVARAIRLHAAERGDLGPEHRGLFLLMTARALAWIRREEAALHFARQVTRDEDAARAVVRALGRPDAPPEWLDWMGRGFLRVLGPAGAGGDGGWLVDFRAIRLEGRDAIELTAAHILQRTVEGVLPLWTPTAGRGCLGLRHLDALARHAAGGGAARQVARACQEWLGWTREALTAAARGRGWPHVPDVRTLDAAC